MDEFWWICELWQIIEELGRPLSNFSLLLLIALEGCWNWVPNIYTKLRYNTANLPKYSQ